MVLCLVASFGLMACVSSPSQNSETRPTRYSGTNLEAERLLQFHPEIYSETKLFQLPVRAPFVGSFSSTEWSVNYDADGDCQNTREEVLIQESLVPVTFASAKACRVTTGEWYCPYTGERIVEPGKLKIDYLIPLKVAYSSGGNLWDFETRRRFANETRNLDHLKAISIRASGKDRAQPPELWMPQAVSYRCTYGEQWIAIKYKWGLAVTRAERTHLIFLLAQCSGTLLDLAPPGSDGRHVNVSGNRGGTL